MSEAFVASADAPLLPAVFCEVAFPELTVTDVPNITCEIIVFNLPYAATTCVWCVPEIVNPLVT